MKNIYIAGPMTGIKDFNYPLFNHVAAELRDKGFHVENPAENPEPKCKSWEGYMRMSIIQIARCDTMVMLPGWSTSRGAVLEHRLAEDLKFDIVKSSELLGLIYA